MYVELLASASWEGDIDNEYWRAHYELLSEEYKNKIGNRSARELAEEIETCECKSISIWK